STLPSTPHRPPSRPSFTWICSLARREEEYGAYSGGAAMASGTGRLEGKVALVTGAGSRGPGIGNGRAIAITLAREGACVALLDQRADWAEETRRMIAAEGGTALVRETDVSRAESCRAAVAAAASAWGRVDILVNNVGIFGPVGTAVEVDDEAWDRAMRVNVTGMVLMAKY